jgi:hypothetical protein
MEVERLAEDLVGVRVAVDSLGDEVLVAGASTLQKTRLYREALRLLPEDF